jgi:putative DNA primase/helicase
VEGEACADALAKRGVPARTSLGGAQRANDTNWAAAPRQPALVWPDHDKAGADYAAHVTAALHALDCTLELIDVEALGLPSKGDAVDWLEMRPDATSADVLALPRLTPEKTGVAGVAGVALGVSRAAPPHLATPPEKGVAKKAARARFELMVNHPRRMDGVYWVGTARDNDTGEEIEKEPEWICSPMVVAATTRNDDGSEWGRQLVFADRDGLEHRWAMPQTMMATDGAELRTELLRQGLEIATDGNRRRKLLDYIQWANPATAARCVTRTGWHESAFVLPDVTYNDEAEPVIYQAATLDGVALGQGGTLDGWREQVAMPSAGNSRLVLSIAAGFAGPCLGLVGAEGGGIHLRGPSSIGKSTALQVAGSIFGPARYVRTWRQTDNALEGVASLHSDLLLILDEIKELAAKDAGAVAYMLGNGQGKGRANRSGAARAAACWRLLFLSSGEVGLGEMIAQGGGQLHAGHEVRFIDVPADAGAGFGLLDRVPDGVAPGQFAEQLKAAAAMHYGHALPAFLERLTADVAGNRKVLMSMRDALTDDLVSGADDGQVRRVAQRFALIAAAGTLATHYGLTGWHVDESEQAARACFRDWLAARGTKGNAEPVAMLAAVKGFLELHGESRFTPWVTDERSPRTVNRAGFRKRTDTGPEYYVESGVFKDEVAKGFEARAVARLLIEHGCMLAGPNGKATRSERLPDGRNTRVYRITPKLWEVEL